MGISKDYTLHPTFKRGLRTIIYGKDKTIRNKFLKSVYDKFQHESSGDITVYRPSGEIQVIKGGETWRKNLARKRMKDGYKRIIRKGVKK